MIRPAVWLLLIVLCLWVGACASPLPSPKTSEPMPLRLDETSLVALRGQFDRAVAPIETRREQAHQDILGPYVALLREMKKEIIASGDLDSALAIEAEIERVQTGGDDQTASAIGQLPIRARRYRCRFEDDIDRVEKQYARDIEAYVEWYAANLQELEAYLTREGNLGGASLVRDERARVASLR